MSGRASWRNHVLLLLGLWLFASAASTDYESRALVLNDLIVGSTVILLAAVDLLRRRPWTDWALGTVGVWHMFAPLAFWAPTAEGYSNATLTGMLIAVLGTVATTVAEPTVTAPALATGAAPRGWSYNPSAWPQRLPIIFLSMLGFLLARYLTAFQLGHIDSAWDPFFADGTETILTSDVSKAFPVSDAGLGAWSYALDAIAGAIGGTRRWRTMPWVVAIFGLMIIPPGVTSIVLVILQPIAVGSWCSICLVTAFIMLVMVPPAIDEVVATAQFLRRARKAGLNLWRTFWFGAELPGEQDVELASVRTGFRVPWHIAGSAVVGAWLMLAPFALGLKGFASDACHFTGALVVTFAVIAFSEVARPLRWANIPLALCLLIGAWLLQLSPLEAGLLSLSGGGLLIMSLPLGTISQRHGDYDKVIFWEPLVLRRRGGSPSGRGRPESTPSRLSPSQ